MKNVATITLAAATLFGSVFAANASDFVLSPRSPEAHDLMPSQKTNDNVDRLTTGSVATTTTEGDSAYVDCPFVVSPRYSGQVTYSCR
ncbi:hypothetical protein [Pararhizobium mangrovi]|uniref:Uncharacterized protein n=1 Tax=Pararhizobium mangrovi TaxID=2590452 RepID=A0A506TX60_9HYPH|nr:hypothetical protein [Pararhizobium mangrovi]TPW25896.1 hypothetical protein FJU11_17175 [Pararhizobium mangrovi]